MEKFAEDPPGLHDGGDMVRPSFAMHGEPQNLVHVSDPPL